MHYAHTVRSRRSDAQVWKDTNMSRIHTYIYTHTYIYVHMHTWSEHTTYTSAHVPTHTHKQHRYALKRPQTHTLVYIYTNIRIYMHTNIHIFMDIYTQSTVNNTWLNKHKPQDWKVKRKYTNTHVRKAHADIHTSIYVKYMQKYIKHRNINTKVCGNAVKGTPLPIHVRMHIHKYVGLTTMICTAACFKT